MTVCLCGNCKTGTITYACSHKCNLDDDAKTATLIDENGDGEIICKDCMGKLQDLISSIFVANLSLIDTEKKKKIKKKLKKRVDLIDLR